MFVRMLSALLLTVTFQTASGEQPSRQEIVVAAKQATALVVVDSQRATGTAFCIDAAGYFVTNQHVLGKAKTASLVLDPGLDSERVISAEVVRADNDGDLVLLRTAGVKDLHALRLGSDAELIETSEVLVFGFPFGKALAIKDQDYPSISVSLGYVTSLRRSAGVLEEIQLDAEINPGNSGGPVLDNSGQVIGIVQKKILGTSINGAIPVEKLHPFLGNAEITFEPPAVKLADAHQPIDVSVQVATFDLSERMLDVSLELSCASIDRRSIKLTAAGEHTYHASVIPVPPTDGAKTIQVQAKFAAGVMSCQVKSQQLQIDGRNVALHDIAKIQRRDGQFAVELNGGEKLTAESITGFPTQADFGAYEITVDMLKASEISLKETAKCNVVDFAVIVAEHGKEIARREGKWRLVTPFGERSPGEATPADDEPTAEFLTLDGESPWPGFLEPSPGAVFDERGLRVHPEQVMRSINANLLEEDFIFEVEVEFKPVGDDAACVGLGEAVYEHDGARNSVFMRLHPVYRENGHIGLARYANGVSSISAGQLRTHGPHRVTVKKRGYSVTFSVDIDDDGPTPDDIKRTIPDIRAFAPVLHGKNTHVFFSRGGTYLKVRFQRLRPVAPMPDSDKLSAFVPWPDYLAPDSQAVVSEDGLKLGEDVFVKSKIGGVAAQDFTLELEFTLPKLGREIGVIGFGAMTPGSRQPLEQSIYLRLHSLHHGEGKVGLNVRGRPEAPAGQFRTLGPHLARIQRRGTTLIFHIDVDNDGRGPDDMTKTVTGIPTVLPFLHEKNTQVFFGSGQYQAVRMTQP